MRILRGNSLAQQNTSRIVEYFASWQTIKIRLRYNSAAAPQFNMVAKKITGELKRYGQC